MADFLINPLLIIIAITAVVLLVVELVNMSVYGWPLIHKKYFKEVKEHFPKADSKVWINSLNSDIICTLKTDFDGVYASKSSPHITFKWYVHTLGVVPRGSKLEEYLDDLYESLKTNDVQTLSRDLESKG